VNLKDQIHDLLTVLGELEEEVRMNDRVGLEFVGEVEEHLEEDASSNAGNGEKEDLGIVCLMVCGCHGRHPRQKFGHEGHSSCCTGVAAPESCTPHAGCQ
jgi:hypothetical protein